MDIAYLDTDANWTVPHVGPSRFLNGIEVNVDDFVEIACDHLGYLSQLHVVEFAILNKHGQADGGKVTNCDLVRRGIFDDFGAKI